MEEKFFRFKDAARIIGCTKRTVQRLFAEGRLKGQAGRPNRGGSALVSEKSLFQFVLVNSVSCYPPKVVRAIRNSRENLERNSRQIAIENRFSMDEGTGNTEPPTASCSTDPSPCPLPQGEGKQRKRCLHHEFAEQHQFSFGWRARQLAPGDLAMQDDLVQEMSLAVLEYNSPANFEYLYELAGNRAIDYLRYEAASGRFSLSQARAVSDTFAEKLASLKTLIDNLRQRGVPTEWIEEVLNERLEVA